MERYKRLLKLEDIKKLTDEKKYSEALEILNTININKIKKYNDLNIISKIYVKNGKYYEAKKILEDLCEKELSQSVLLQLIYVSLKIDNFVDVEKYYEQYSKIASEKDKYICRYKIDKEKGKDIKILIESIEGILKYEYTEEWAYRLAKLYYKFDERTKCIEECNKIEEVFLDGIIVEKAKLLKEHCTNNVDTDDNKEFSATSRLNEILDSVRETMNVDKQEQDESQNSSLEESNNNMDKTQTSNINLEMSQCKEKIEQLFNIKLDNATNMIFADGMADALNIDNSQMIKRNVDELFDMPIDYNKESRWEDNYNEHNEKVKTEDNYEENNEEIELEDNFKENNEEIETKDNYEENNEEIETEENYEENNEETENEYKYDEINNYNLNESLYYANNEDYYEEDYYDNNNNNEEKYYDSVKKSEDNYYVNNKDEGENRAYYNDRRESLNKHYVDLNPDIFCNYYEINELNNSICNGIYNLQINMLRGNFIISGAEFSGRTTIARMIAKQLYEMRYVNTNKIARINGSAFNKVNLSEKITKLLDGCVIIQKAEEVKSQAFDSLINMINCYPGRLIVFLETTSNYEDLYKKNPDLEHFFTSVITMPKYRLEELIEFAHSYAAMDDFYISDSAEDAIRKVAYYHIKERGYDDNLAMITNIVDNAIEKFNNRVHDTTSEMYVLEIQDIL